MYIYGLTFPLFSISATVLFPDLGKSWEKARGKGAKKY